MSLKPGIYVPTVLIDRYINTAYDKVLTVADNISLIQNISDEISDGNISCSIVVPNASVTIGEGVSTINLTSYGITYILGRNQLQVFVNGIYQSIASNALDEIDTTTIKLNEELVTDDVIDIIKII